MKILHDRTLSPEDGYIASGPFEILLNGEPFHTEKVMIFANPGEDDNANRKAVAFYSPREDLVLRVLAFTIPYTAQPGRYYIKNTIPPIGVYAQYSIQLQNPNEDEEWVRMYLILDGYMDLIDWDPVTLHFYANFVFTASIDGQPQHISARFNLVALQ